VSTGGFLVFFLLTPDGALVNKIALFLCFNDHAEEAMNFYVSVFKGSRWQDLSGPGVDNERGPHTGPVRLHDAM
jgi:predicted 3-demethylubiquinone-9 3-methyltransferase (glyoxalase superfamily)